MKIPGCFSRNFCITDTRAGIGSVFTCVWVLCDDGGYPGGNLADPLDKDDVFATPLMGSQRGISS